MLSDKIFLLQHVDAYFKYLYPVPCLAFLHRETTYRQIEEGRLSMMLARSICSITAMLVGRGEDALSFSAECGGQVEQYLFQNMGKIEPDTLRLSVLAAVYNWVRGDQAKYWMYHGIAARLCKALPSRWHDDNGGRP